VRTRIKICGITNAADAQMCAALGADALGLNFYEQSPRHLSLESAIDVAAATPALVSVVALFVNPKTDLVHSVIERIRPSLLQFHGDESAGFCEQFRFPYIKACRMGEGVDLLEYMRPFAAARAWLADAYSAQYGGSGKRFDWDRLPAIRHRPLILSGGLDPRNAGTAVIGVRPWALDVCSGVESSKGIKDPERVASFIAEVRNADG